MWFYIEYPLAREGRFQYIYLKILINNLDSPLSPIDLIIGINKRIEFNKRI